MDNKLNLYSIILLVFLLAFSAFLTFAQISDVDLSVEIEKIKVVKEQNITNELVGPIVPDFEKDLEISGIDLKVERLVYNDLRDDGWAKVIIKLDDSKFDFSSAEHTAEFLGRLREFVAKKQEAVLSQLSEKDFKLISRYKVVSGFSGEVTSSGLQKLIKHPLVKNIYAEKILYPTLQESVPLINVDDVWQIQGPLGNTTGRGQAVCVMDSGIDYTHSDLGGCTQQQFLSGQCSKVPGGYDFYGTFNGPNPMDDHGHGTHVAGIVAANGGIKGVAPDSKLLAVKVCGFDIFGRFGCPNTDMLEGVDWCINDGFNYGVSILTMSIGDEGEYSSQNCPTWLDNEIELARILNLPFTISSGNNGHKNGISYPACSPSAISVGATYDADVGSKTWCTKRDTFGNCIRECSDNTTFADKVACFTNSANNLTLMAPGSVITSTLLSGGYWDRNGTSQAAPHVAGVFALLKQYTENSLYVQQMIDILKNTGVPVIDSGNGLTFKRIDALAAINSVCVTPTDGMIINRDTKLCQGTYSLPNGISIGANGITLDCNEAILIGPGTSSGRGISSDNYNNVVIKNCNVQNYGRGISLNFSNSNILTNNTATSNSIGISLNRSNSNTLTFNTAIANTMGDFKYGIFLESSSNNTITSNTANSNHNGGIFLYSSSDSNTLIGNTTNSNENGITLDGSNNTLTNNNADLNNNTGINISGSANYNTLINNNVNSNRYYGIQVPSSNNTIISNTASYNGSSGILIYSSSSNNNLANNIANNNTWGIYLLSSTSSNILTNNTANSNSYDGISLSSSSNNNLISNTTSSNGNMGILLSSSNNNTLTFNIANLNYNGILIHASSLNNNLISNTASSNGNYGIFLSSFSNSNTLANNIATDNSIGISLFGSSDSNILSSNTANSNNRGDYKIGIFLDSSSDNILADNTADNNFGGIILDSSSNNTLTNNNTDFNSMYGIFLDAGSNSNTLTLNSAVNNYQGIRISASSSNILTGNTANLNRFEGIFLSSGNTFNTLDSNTVNGNGRVGIFLAYSNSNTITSNTVVDNNYGGIFLEPSNSNLIYNNYFDNTVNVEDGGNNFWNTTRTVGTNIIGGPYLGGNFWIDYAGGDLDGDGLGDTFLPYNSQGNIQNGGDVHPLTNMVLPGSFTVQFGALISGILQDLFYSDNSRVIVEVSRAIETVIPISIIVKATSSTTTPGVLRFEIESSVVGPSVAEQRIELLNYQTNGWEEVSREFRTSSDSTTEVVITNNPERFINSVSREMQARIGFSEVSAEIVSWSARFDQAIWRITP